MALQQATYAVPRLDLAEAFQEYDDSGMELIASQVLPIINVPKKAGTFSVLTRENLARADVKRAKGGAFNRIDLESEDKAYACEQYGLESALDDEDRENYATDFDAEEATVKKVWLNLMNEFEIRVKTLLFNTTTWTGTPLYTDVSAAPWDAAASDAIAHVLAAKELVRANCGRMPNTMVISAKTRNNLLGNTGIKARFPGSSLFTEQMLKDAMASIFGIPNLLVGGAVYNSALEGQSFTGADIWSDDYAWIGVIPGAGSSIKEYGVGRTALWTPLTPSVDTVEQYREEQTTSDIFRCRHAMVSQVFDAYAGHLLKVDA